MKRILLSLALGFVVATASASNPVVEQFINGSGMYLTNGVTYYYGWTNIPTFSAGAVGGLYSGQPDRLFYSLTTSNMVPTVVSNSLSGWAPGTLYWTNRSSYTNTLPAAGGIVVNTNIIQPRAWVDVPAWCDGEAGAGKGVLTITAASINPNATATNNITFTFAPIYNTTNDVDSGSLGSGLVVGIDVMYLTIGITNGAERTIKTNLSDAFMLGAQKIRLVSVANAESGTGTNILVKFVTAAGYTTP